MKYISLLAGIFFLSCTNKIVRRLPTSKGIIISCIRCSCIDIDFNRLIDSKDSVLRDLTVYGDTSCFKPKGLFSFYQLNQKSIDSIYKRNYNAILFKKRAWGVDFRIIKSGQESFEMKKIIKSFFNDDL